MHKITACILSLTTLAVSACSEPVKIDSADQNGTGQAGQVLNFTIKSIKHGYIVAEADPTAGTTEDYEATAIALVEALPMPRTAFDNWRAEVLRNDLGKISEKMGGARFLAVAERNTLPDTPWSVSSFNPVPSLDAVKADEELAEFTDKHPNAPEKVVQARAEQIAKAHKIDTTGFDPVWTALYIVGPTPRIGKRSLWNAQPGPGSKHIATLSTCIQESKDWANCH